MRCLVEAIKRVDQEKASNTQKRVNHDISSGILKLMLSYKQRSKDKASQPQEESALDHKWFSNHMGKEWISLLMIGLHQTIIGLHIAIGVMNWNLCDYPVVEPTNL